MAIGEMAASGRTTVQVQRYCVLGSDARRRPSHYGRVCRLYEHRELCKPANFYLQQFVDSEIGTRLEKRRRAGTWRVAVRNTVLIGSLTLPFTLAILAVGDTVMRFLYHGTEYEGHGYTLTVLTLAIFCGALSMPASIALVTLERPRAIVTTGVVGAILTVVLVWPLMKQWGLLGAACGALVGAATVGIARWVIFRIRVPKGRDPAFVMRALQELEGFGDNSHWKIMQIGEGLHAEIFLMQSNGLPIWNGHLSLVAKLYKPPGAAGTHVISKRCRLNSTRFRNSTPRCTAVKSMVGRFSFHALCTSTPRRWHWQ